MEIRLRLKEWRERRGLTQWGLAEKSGVGYATIARLEIYPGNPRLTTLYRLAEALGVDPRDLLPEREKRPTERPKTRQRAHKRKRRGRHGGVR